MSRLLENVDRAEWRFEFYDEIEKESFLSMRVPSRANVGNRPRWLEGRGARRGDGIGVCVYFDRQSRSEVAIPIIISE